MGLFIIMEYVRVESVFTVHGHSTAFVARVASCRLASLNMNNARGMCVCVASVLVPVCVNSRNSGWHISNGKIANNRRNQTAKPFSRRQLYLDAFDACDCVNSLCLPVVFISFFSFIFSLFFFGKNILVQNLIILFASLAAVYPFWCAPHLSGGFRFCKRCTHTAASVLLINDVWADGAPVCVSMWAIHPYVDHNTSKPGVIKYGTVGVVFFWCAFVVVARQGATSIDPHKNDVQITK